MGHRHRAVGFLGARILVRDHGEQVENSSWNAVRVGMSRALCIGKKEERGNVCTQARRNPWGRKAKGIPYISISLSLSSFDRSISVWIIQIFFISFLELHIDLKSNMETTNTWANVLLTRARFYDCKKCPIKFISFFFLSNLFIYLGV